MDIEDYNPEFLNIFSREILQMISDGKSGWENMLPERTSEMIKSQNLFGYKEPVLEKKE